MSKGVADTDTKENYNDTSIWIGNIPANVLKYQLLGALKDQGYKALNKDSMKLKKAKKTNTNTQHTIVDFGSIQLKQKAIKKGIKFGQVPLNVRAIISSSNPQPQAKFPCSFGDQCKFWKTGKCKHYHQFRYKPPSNNRSIISSSNRQPPNNNNNQVQPCSFGDQCKFWKAGKCKKYHQFPYKPPAQPPSNNNNNQVPCGFGNQCKFWKAGNCKNYHRFPYKAPITTPSNTPYQCTKFHPSRRRFGGNSLNVGFYMTALIDLSSSMRGKRIKAAVKGLEDLLSHLHDNDIISIIGFSDTPVTLLEPSKYDQVKDKIPVILKKCIYMLSRGTAMWDAMDKALKKQKKFIDKNVNNNKKIKRKQRIIVVTDGKDTASQKSANNVISDVAYLNMHQSKKDMQFALTVIAVGKAKESAELKTLCKPNYCYLVPVDDAYGISQAIGDSFQ